ncbi:hypothetical protein [Salinisphaera hydrothermalis]|uniref:hypothetical protein n=1 Tax=Salinisphaera hydrothermalis TaxID=563188 RepID=UPI00333F1B31
MNSAWHNIAWLLRRETMEHRRLLYAPAILGGVVIGLNLIMLVIGLINHTRTSIRIQFESGSVLNALALKLNTLDPGEMADLGQAIALLLLAVLLLFLLAFGAATLNYALGCLFEERRDRSILFWKSLPTTDGQSVAAKALIAMLALPVLYTVAALITGWVTISTYLLLLLGSGASAAQLLAETHLGATTALTLAALPIYILTIAPVTGWMMLCSAVSRRHPMLMAILVPALFAVLGALGLPNPVWHLLVGQILPTGYTAALSSLGHAGGFQHALALLYRPLATLDLWLGLVFAVACLVGATVYRHRCTTLV